VTDRGSIDRRFAESIPQIYDTHLVPLIFEPYAADLARRLSAMPVSRVLEIAAGTGVVTRALAAALPAEVSIVATDLNQAMLDRAAAAGTKRPVEWRVADAMALPFDDASFDAVVCQFGAMFLPDKPRAFAEARRVLTPDGLFLFNVWDRIEENEFSDTVTNALAALFPNDPPRFMARTPHGYCDVQAIERDLRAGGFAASPRVTTLSHRSRAALPRIPAIAFCQGTPLRDEIQSRAGASLAEATDAVAEVLSMRFGQSAIEGRIQAHVVAVATRRDR